MSVRRFGRLGEVDIDEVTLSNGAGAQARIISWGAVLRDLVVPGRSGPQHVVLGLDRLEDYLQHSPYFGAIVGRYANRIGGARFRLGGQDVELIANENRNELHGGPAGFGKKPWSLLEHDGRSAYFGLLSRDGDMGYPGRLFASASYELEEPATLKVTLEAFADEPTPVNLTIHNYYNLDGSADIRDHRLMIAADHITPTDPEQIPTGEITAVAGTRFDLGRSRTIRTDAPYENYDMNYVLARERSAMPELAHAATLASDLSGIAMELWTTEPGLQFYDGHLVDLPVPGLEGVRYGPYAGVALEPQRFPDGPNRSYFPPCILKPGEVSRQATEFRFSVAGS